MTTTTPIQQPAMESLRNALQIAQLWADFGPVHASGGQRPFEDIGRLLRAALEQLAEPTPAALDRMRYLLDSHQAMTELEPDYDRYLRDSVALILHAQLEGTL